MSERPLPVAPLEAAIAAGRPDFCAADVAVCLGVSKRTVEDWRLRGLSVWQADRWAIAAGFHPAEVWGDWADRLLEIVDAELCEAAA